MWLKLNNGEVPVTYNMDFVKRLKCTRISTRTFTPFVWYMALMMMKC